MSDGETLEKGKVKNHVSQLRQMWSNVDGIGITKDGNNMVNLFAPTHDHHGKWVVCENPSKLAEVMCDVVMSGFEDLDT